MSDKRRYIHYEPEAMWRAVVRADGNLTEAHRLLGMGEHTAPGYIVVKMSAAAARIGIIRTTNKPTTAQDRVAMAQALLGQGSVVLSETNHRGQAGMKVVGPVYSEPVKRPEMPATCHPDREEFQLRLCRPCYDARMRRSQAATAAGEVDRVQRRIEPIEHRRSGSKSGPIMRTRVTSEGKRVLTGVYAPEVVQDQLRGLPGRQGYGMPLTERELEVMKLVAAGQINKAIGHSLGVSEQTVKNHLSSILKKLGAATRSEAVVRMGWVHTNGFDLNVMLQRARVALGVIGEAHEAAKAQVAALEASIASPRLDELTAGDTIREAG